MIDPFDQKKKVLVDEIEQTLAEIEADASPKGTIDELCVPIIKLINQHKDMVTTSSCSGRVSVFVEGLKEKKGKEEDYKIGAKGDGGHWLFVTHDDVEIDNWWKDKNINFEFQKHENYHPETLPLSTRYVLYKYEPLILHVKCRDLKTAHNLYTTAMSCGYRESGIGVNNSVAIRTSIRLDIPIAYLSESEEMLALVPESYLYVACKLSHDRFAENAKKLQHLYDVIEKNLINAAVPEKEETIETKEQRKERKMREGLARREGVRAAKEAAKKLKELELANQAAAAAAVAE